MNRIICHHCQKTLRTENDCSGKRVRCPACKGIIDNPLTAEASPASKLPQPEPPQFAAPPLLTTASVPGISLEAPKKAKSAMMSRLFRSRPGWFMIGGVIGIVGVLGTTLLYLYLGGSSKPEKVTLPNDSPIAQTAIAKAAGQLDDPHFKRNDSSIEVVVTRQRSGRQVIYSVAWRSSTGKDVVTHAVVVFHPTTLGKEVWDCHISGKRGSNVWVHLKPGSGRAR